MWGVISPRGRTMLRAGLLTILTIIIIHAWATDLIRYPVGVDLQIPLVAAERWEAGATPYLAEAFHAPPGSSQPFLYPPYLLPFFVVLADIPTWITFGTWIAAGIVFACVALRVLGVRVILWPLLMLWPPLAEPLIGGNLQVGLFLAFVAVFYEVHLRGKPRERDIATTSRWRRVGLLSAAVGAVKVSQPHAVLYLLRHRSRAGVFGLLIASAIVLATLPLTGVAIWFDWIAQLQRTQDPSWSLGGFALPDLLGPLGTVGCIAATVAVLLVGKKNAAVWVGILATIGSTSLHIFGLLFLIPAMLFVPVEVALLVATLIATYTYEGAWAGILLISVVAIATSATGVTSRGDEALVLDDSRLAPGRSPRDPVAVAPLTD